MVVDLNKAVLREIDSIKKTISLRTSQIAQLRHELKRHETVLKLLGQKKKPGQEKRRQVSLNEVLAQIPETFTTRDFVKAAAKTRKSSLYLRQTLSRWTKQGKIKRVERGNYRKPASRRVKAR